MWYINQVLLSLNGINITASSETIYIMIEFLITSDKMVQFVTKSIMMWMFFLTAIINKLNYIL